MFFITWLRLPHEARRYGGGAIESLLIIVDNVAVCDRCRQIFDGRCGFVVAAQLSVSPARSAASSSSTSAKEASTPATM
jgi:hypothetical protein